MTEREQAFWESEAGLRRREFLERTAYAAGLAGLASVLPASVLLDEAAKAASSPLPADVGSRLEHVVVVCMENRSFDHYFGWLGEIADATQEAAYVDQRLNGTSPEDPETYGEEVHTVHASEMDEAQWQGCGHPDPGHGWDSGRRQLQNGFLANGSGNDIFALTYYDEGELEFIHGAANKFTLYDGFFCSALTSTWPNRYYKWSGNANGRKNNSPPIQTLGNQWETIFDVALKANRTALYYNSDLPFSAVWGPRGIPWTQGIARYYADCAAGTLPNIAFVDPPFRDGGGFDGNSADEHPHGDVRLGQAWMADVVNAFVQSPNFRNGALFVVYDEWGGFFDHVTPPKAPDDLASSNLNEDWGQMGFRIPAVCVSPWTLNPRPDTRKARVAHGHRYGFESILKLMIEAWGLPYMKPLGGSQPLKRLVHAHNIGASFDWDVDETQVERPELPDPVHVVSRPCSAGGGDVLTQESADAHVSDLAGLEELAERFGFPIGSGAPHELFTKPDSVRRALRASS